MTEAYQVGGAAVEAAMRGETAKMAAIKRLSDQPPRVETEMVDVTKVANFEKKVPADWITEDGMHVNEKFGATPARSSRPSCRRSTSTACRGIFICNFGKIKTEHRMKMRRSVFCCYEGSASSTTGGLRWPHDAGGVMAPLPLRILRGQM